MNRLDSLYMPGIKETLALQTKKFSSTAITTIQSYFSSVLIYHTMSQVGSQISQRRANAATEMLQSIV